MANIMMDVALGSLLTQQRHMRTRTPDEQRAAPGTPHLRHDHSQARGAQQRRLATHVDA
jgi:hypothetical protein